MKAGALEGLSIGFRAEKGVRDPRSAIRKLTKIDLWEFSVVTFPMQPGATITAVKSRPPTQTQAADDSALVIGLCHAAARMNDLTRSSSRKTRTI